MADGSTRRKPLPHSMLLPTPDMNPPSGLSEACASEPPIWIGGGFALAFFPSDISVFSLLTFINPAE